MSTIETTSPLTVPEQWRDNLLAALIARQRKIRTFDSYYDGKHKLLFATVKFRETFGTLFSAFSDNWCDLVVDSSAERLRVDGFRFGDDEKADSDAREIWQRNDLDAESELAHTEAIKLGCAYALVGPDDGEPMIQLEPPTNAIVAVDPAAGRKRLAGLRYWADEWGVEHAVVYLPDAIVWWLREREHRGWTEDVGSGRNALGVVPLVPLPNMPTLRNRQGRSDVERVIPLQDAVNKLCADMIVASEFAAFPQRWMTGIEIPVYPDGDPNAGQPLPSFTARFLAGAGVVWADESENAKMGNFAVSDLGIYVRAIEMFIQHVAAQTRTPPHYLLGAMGSFPSGEAIALDTPVPTPDGWTTMGDLDVGDAVFDEAGEVQIVTDAFEALEDRQCYRVRFDDGVEIVADAGHKWLTTHVEQGVRVRRVVCTEEIARTVRVPPYGTGRSRDGRGIANHRIALTGALDLPDADLPIDPYVLGVWLADGALGGSQVTVNGDDANFIASMFEGADEPVTRREVPGRNAEMIALATRGGTSRPVGQMRQRLAEVGVRECKHVPAAYMQASTAQRLELLRGFMDSDGHATRDGRASFDLHDERLARDLLVLIRSLGHKAALRTNHYTNRLGSWTRYRVAWSPLHVVFRLPRKVERQRVDWGVRPRTRYIVACEPCESVSVRCIAVTGPSHLFLCGDGFVPTHNSLKATETGLVAKVKRKQLAFGEGWEETIRLAFKVTGDDARASATDCETIWMNPESRSTAEITDAAVKMSSIGVPLPVLWEYVGATPQQIERWEAMGARTEGPAISARESVTVQPAPGEAAVLGVAEAAQPATSTPPQTPTTRGGRNG